MPSPRRISPCWFASILGIAAVAIVAPVTTAAPPNTGSRADAAPADFRRKALAAARTGASPLRKEILGQLAATSDDDTVDLVVRVGLSSPDESVRAMARGVIAALREDATQEAAIVERAAKELREGRAEAAADLAAVLLAGEAPADAWPVAAWLDDAGPAGVKLSWAVATAAAGRANAEDVATLRGLARLRLFSIDHPFRRGVVRALISVNRIECVHALVAILADLRGEARADVVAYLSFVSGRNFGTDAAAWAEWLTEHRDTFDLPPPPDEYPLPNQPLESADNRDDPAYYGIPLYAERVVFLIDVSSSMQEMGRLEKAKRELESAIWVLPPTTAFTIVAYSDRAAAWSPQLVPADETAKKQATTFVSRLRPDGTTATGDALALAFTFDVEAVYLLSDGAPTAGRVVAPAQIVQMVADANRARRVSVHTIGIAADPRLAEFLAVLARENYGRFRRVDD